MTLNTHSLILRGVCTAILLFPFVSASAKDNNKEERRGNLRERFQQPQNNNQPKFQGNLPGSGGSNNQPRFNNPPVTRNPLGGQGLGQGNVGGGNQNARKIEIPRGQNPGNAGGGNNQGPLGNRLQTMPKRDNKPVFNTPNNNSPALVPQADKNVLKRRDNDNRPNLGGQNNAQGGGQPNLRRRESENKPNFGGNNNPLGGGQPVLKRRENDNKPGGVINNPNLGGNNPLGGGQPVLKRRENDNRPNGGLNKPNLGGNNNNPLGGGQPVLKRRENDNKPGNGINLNPNGGNNPLGNNFPRNNTVPRNNRNPELKNQLKQFQPNVAKRQENERQLLRNKDQVEKLLGDNPKLRERIQRGDGKVDLSRLHLEHGGKDRISANIHKNGNLPFRLDDKDDLKQQFRHMGRAKNLDDLDRHFKHFQDSNVLKQHPEFAKLNFKHASGKFQHNIINVNNNYNTLLVSNVGKQLHLQQQYNLYQHGDVARQMNLNIALINGGGWGNRYVGPVYGNYTQACFSSWYCGPGYYPHYCWTPTWSPWVDWCWWDTCLPIYDPRPLYCRPVVYYDPCPVWTVYTYPVWQPLPVVTCGTWVDYTPVLVENVDLQLVAVRFVDNGHPEQQLGSRYRIWLQNNSRVGIAGNFNVLLLASNSPEANAELPQAGITIPSMEAGEMQVVDVRLPYAASKMNRVDNHLTPFNFLHVLVDSHRQLDDVNLANNGAVIPRSDILPVDPAAFAPDVSAAAPGAIVSLAGEGFGPEPGRLIVSVNGEQTEATIYGWYDLGVQFELPYVAVNGPTDAEVLVVRGDGAASNPVTVRLAPENRLQEAALPAAPLP